MRRSCNESHSRSARNVFKATELGASCDYSICPVMDRIKLYFCFIGAFVPNLVTMLKQGTYECEVHFSSACLLTLNLGALI